jgi:hypothetical protein
VIQGVVLVFVIIYSHLSSAELDFIHANYPVRTIVDAITTRIDIRIGDFSKEFITRQMISLVGCCLI